MTEQHKVLLFDRIGEDTGLVFRNVPRPVPGPNEIRYKVDAYGLNQADLLVMQGRHYVTPDFPISPGIEAAGVVDAVGDAVTKFKVGDRITVLPNVDGPYTTAVEYALAEADFATLWPAGWTAAESAGFWMQYLTAYYPMKEIFPFNEGDWVMVTAASGGTGLGAIAIAKLLGARVIATSRTFEKRDFLLAEGADAVIATDLEHVVERVKEITDGKGVTLINDTIGGGFVAEYVEALAYDGRIYIHGGLSGTNNVTFPIVELVRARGAIHGYSLINELRDEAARDRGVKFVLDAIASGALKKPVIDSVFPYAQAEQAYARLGIGAQRGKIVVDVSGEGR